MAAVAAPNVADLERSYDPGKAIVRHDAKRDTLTIHLGQPRPAVSYDVRGEAWIRYVPDSREVVGIEIEDFEKYFLKQHPELATFWSSANGRKALRSGSNIRFESFLDRLVGQLKVLLSEPPIQRASSTPLP
jgi:hypothetical protein